MRFSRSLRFVITSLVTCGLCLPTSASYGVDATRPAEPTANSGPGAMIRDVALAPGGLLVGQVLDDTLRPVEGAAVEIQANGQTMATTVTDHNGVFAVTGLRGGNHQIATQGAIENCRLWAPGSAPPRAVQHLRFVPGGSDAVRGQWGPPPTYDQLACQAKAMATNPWVIGGVIVAAVGIPIWLANEDDDSGS